MYGYIIGIALILAAIVWFIHGGRTAVVPEGGIGSNEEFERLSAHYSAPCAVLATFGLLIILLTWKYS